MEGGSPLGYHSQENETEFNMILEMFLEVVQGIDRKKKHVEI